MTPVGKKSKGKNTLGGRKFAMRRLGESGRAEAEIIGLGAAPVGDGNDRHLLVDIVKDGQLYVQAAAGVVADSVPEMEWRETEHKARALLRAAELVEEGLR